jgi:hypothetical protein
MLKRQYLRSCPAASSGGVSRRSILARAAVCAVGGGLASELVSTHRALAATKMAKSQAGYKDSPRGGQRCDACVQFDPPAACKIVDGAINPSGSCDLFAPKPR